MEFKGCWNSETRKWRKKGRGLRLDLLPKSWTKKPLIPHKKSIQTSGKPGIHVGISGITKGPTLNCQGIKQTIPKIVKTPTPPPFFIKCTSLGRNPDENCQYFTNAEVIYHCGIVQSNRNPMCQNKCRRKPSSRLISSLAAGRCNIWTW